MWHGWSNSAPLFFLVYMDWILNITIHNLSGSHSKIRAIHWSNMLHCCVKCWRFYFRHLAFSVRTLSLLDFGRKQKIQTTADCPQSFITVAWAWNWYCWIRSECCSFFRLDFSVVGISLSGWYAIFLYCCHLFRLRVHVRCTCRTHGLTADLTNQLETI